MGPLTNWVLEEALAQCAAWRSAGHAMTVSVNVSATNLLDAGFIELVRGLLERYELPADALILEITETSLITEFERSQAGDRATARPRPRRVGRRFRRRLHLACLS